MSPASCIRCSRTGTMVCGVCGLPYCGMHFQDTAHVEGHLLIDAAQRTIDRDLAKGARTQTVREALAAVELAGSLLRAVLTSGGVL